MTDIDILAKIYDQLMAVKLETDLAANTTRCPLCGKSYNLMITTSGNTTSVTTVYPGRLATTTIIAPPGVAQFKHLNTCPKVLIARFFGRDLLDQVPEVFRDVDDRPD